MSYDFSGRRCLVTGAGKGIGRGISLALVNAGAHVFALTRSPEDLKTMQAEVSIVGKEKMVCIGFVVFVPW